MVETPIFCCTKFNFYVLVQQVNATATRFTQCHMIFSKFVELNKFSQSILKRFYFKSSFMSCSANSSWLPINFRIKFKISSLTFKLLAENQPANLRSLITPIYSSTFTEVIWQISPSSTTIGADLSEIGTQYHCPFDFLHRSHRLNETWKLLFCFIRYKRVYRIGDQVHSAPPKPPIAGFRGNRPLQRIILM